MTLDKPLRYVTSMRILAHTGLCFHTNFTHLPLACQVFSAVSEENFRDDIDNCNYILLWICFLYLIGYSAYTSARNLVSAIFVCDYNKG